MGQPFKEMVENQPSPMQDDLKSISQLARDERDSIDGFHQSTRLYCNSFFPKSAAPYDALQAAEAYLQQIDQSKSAFGRSDVHHRQTKKWTLLETLVSETRQQSQEGPARFVCHQKAPSGDVFQGVHGKKGLAHAEFVDLDISEEFSLDVSHSEFEPQEAFPSSPKWQEVLPGGNSTEAADVYSMSSKRGRLKNRAVSSPRHSSDSVQLSTVEREELNQPSYETAPKTMEWDAVFRGMSTAWLPDSSLVANETFRRSGVSSRGSLDSISDEAISHRAAAWGNRVAKMVLKNSSRETTPRNYFYCSSVGTRRRYSEEIPQVSKHVKDVLSSFQLAFMVCDAIKPEGPILYASAGFFRMTGYSAEEVIGRNCWFLQGVDTDAEEISRIDAALKKGEAYTGTLLNYKKDGTPFWNLLTLSPICDDERKIIKYIGMQAEVTSQVISLRVDRQKEMAIELTSYKSNVQKSQRNGPASAYLPTALAVSEIPGIVVKSQSSRFDRDDSMPVFSLPTSKATATHNLKGRCTASNWYSLTMGRSESRIESKKPLGQIGRYSLTIKRSIRGSIESRPCGDCRHSFAMGRRHSIESGRRPTETEVDLSESQPLIWQIAAERRLENKPGLGSLGLPSSDEVPETTTRENFQGRNKITRGALRLLRLLRNLDLKLSRHRLQGDASVPSKRSKSETADSKTEFDKTPQSDAANIFQYQPERQNIRGPSLELLKSAEAISSRVVSDLRAGSSRYSTTMTSNILNKRQFCIVHT